MIPFSEYQQEENVPELDEKEISDIVDSLKWEDIFDMYPPEDLVIDPPSEDDLSDDMSDNESQDQEQEIEEAMNQSQRMRRGLIMKRNQYKLKLARRTKLARMSNQNTLAMRAMLAARRIMYKRFAGGRPKESLSPQERAMVEQRLSQRKKLLGSIAVRMMPKMRSIESSRLTHKFS